MLRHTISSKILTVVMTFIGSIIFAIGLNGFIIPHNLLSGGVSGIAVMLYYLTGWSPGTVNLIFNLPMLFAAYKWLGRWAVFTTILGTVVCSGMIDIFSFLTKTHLTDTPLVGSIVGGILIGVGSGLIYRTGGNTGGIDPIALIVRKYWGLQMGSVIFIINSFIITASAFLFNIEIAVITLISIYITATVTNKVVVGFNQQKAIYIMSDYSELITEQVIDTIGRGATLLYGKGAYTKQDKKVALIVVSLMQVTRVKNLVHEIDPTAFLLITDASEVIGLGFTQKMPPPPQGRRHEDSDPSLSQK